MPLFGIETEYGISVDTKGASDLMDESRALVKAYPGRSASPWYYQGEDPRNDVRGFHVDRLAQDPDDALFDMPDHKPLPVHEERADRVLTNGARLYNDHGHPEYATPECSTLHDLVTHDKAGERVILAAAQARMDEKGANRVQIFKNNTDFHGSSYGTHESYLIGRDLPFPDLLAGLLPFFVTRIIYAGAGKLGIEPNGSPSVYQLSQRADFFTEEASVDTLYRRPLVNTRDEPHADPRLYRRLHVICGDANMSEFATALKVGTTWLVTSLLETGWKPPVRLVNPVQAIKEISRDQTYKWEVRTHERDNVSAIDLQRIYLYAAENLFKGRGADTDWVLSNWESTLNTLESDPLSLDDRLDWVAKRSLIADYAEYEGLDWKSDALRSVDLAYCNIDPEEGLYYGLEQSGAMVRLTDDDEIGKAMTNAPAVTRAAIRGALVERFAEDISRIGWSKVILRSSDQAWVADLDDYLTPESVAVVMGRLNTDASLADFIKFVYDNGKSTGR